MRLILGSLFLLVALMPAQAGMKYDQIQVTSSGKQKGEVDVLDNGDKLLIDAKEMSQLLGGTAYWYPKSSRLMLRIKDKKIQLDGGKKEYLFDQDKRSFDRPVSARSGTLFVPLEFFTSREMAGIIGKDIVFNEDAHSIDIEKRYDIGDLDYFSYGGVTRVSVEAKGSPQYSSSEKYKKVVELVFPQTVLKSEDRIAFDDGLVRSVNMSQKGPDVVMTLVLEKEAGSWKALSEQDSVVVEVESAAQEVPPGGAAPSQPVAAVEKEEPPELTVPEAVSAAPSGKKRVVVDAGHGGKDPGGTRRNGVPEKTINLAVANELQKLLEADKVFDVIMTRASDSFVPLDGRSQLANNASADVFISIHANAHRRRQEQGFEVFFMSEDASDPWAAEVAAAENAVRWMEKKTGSSSADMVLHLLARNEYLNDGSQLAGLVVKSLDKKVPFKNRGVKQAEFYVLRGTYSPAILVETGFMTNKGDAKNLNDPKVHKKIAQGIYDGLVKYAKLKGWKN